nr:immunoglobulin light chain junction region [Macaca mulatta]
DYYCLSYDSSLSPHWLF